MPSDAMENLSYKELQNIAMVLNIPANLKTSRLLQVIEAKRAGNESLVERLLNEHRDQRKSGRAKGASNPKRRKVQPAQRLQVPAAFDPENTESTSTNDKVLSEESTHTPINGKFQVSSSIDTKISTCQHQLLTIASPPTANPLYCQARMELSDSLQPKEHLYNRFELYSALPNDQVPTSLELIMNIRPQMPQHKPTFAVTLPSYCYVGCLCTPMFSPYNHDKSHASSQAEIWPPSDSLGPSPNFRQNDQISYPLIYSYLASTEEQILQQKFSQRMLLQEESNWTPPEPLNHLTNEVTELGGINIQEPSDSLPDKSSLTGARDDTTKENPKISEEKNSEQENKRGDGEKNHTESKDGLPEETLRVNCPQDDCNWAGHLRLLAAHLRQEHGETIVSASETSHTITLQELMNQKHLYCLQEAGRRLFIVCAHCEGNLIYVTIQSIPSGRSGLSHGTLEIVANDGRPYSWRGHIRSCHEPLQGLWARKNCLLVDPAALGISTQSSITLHCSISFHVPSTVHRIQKQKRSR